MNGKRISSSRLSTFGVYMYHSRREAKDTWQFVAWSQSGTDEIIVPICTCSWRKKKRPHRSNTQEIYHHLHRTSWSLSLSVSTKIGFLLMFLRQNSIVQILCGLCQVLSMDCFFCFSWDVFHKIQMHLFLAEWRRHHHHSLWISFKSSHCLFGIEETELVAQPLKCHNGRWARRNLGQWKTHLDKKLDVLVDLNTNVKRCPSPDIWQKCAQTEKTFPVSLVLDGTGKMSPKELNKAI